MEDDGYYTLDQLCEKFGGVARPTIKRWIRDRNFPRGVLPGKVEPVSSQSKYGEDYTRSHNCRVLYSKREVHAWEATLPREPVMAHDHDIREPAE